MKLLQKYNRYTIGSSILAFLAGCVAFYFIVRHVLISQLDDSLRTEQTEILSYVSTHDHLPEVVDAYNQTISFSPGQTLSSAARFRSVKSWNNRHREEEWRRELQFPLTAGGNRYVATVSKSQVETEDILKLVLLVGAGMIALILVMNYLITSVMLKRLWNPFYETLRQAEQYQLAQQQPLVLPESDIYEFELLNRRLEQVTEKAGQEYRMVKEFSTNAAHEMQTPLAVIRINTENLMQDEEVLQRHNRSVQHIEHSVNRLTRLNQALLLLTKIGNRQFQLNEDFLFNVVVQEKLEELSELIQAKKIRLNTQLQAAPVRFNRFLAETMVQNLLNNAIRHNRENGDIDISCHAGKFSICNSSDLPQLDTEKISSRFYRHPETQAEGNGLGLSIVQQACEQANFRLQYAYHDNRHCFSIIFSPPPGTQIPEQPFA